MSPDATHMKVLALGGEDVCWGGSQEIMTSRQTCLIGGCTQPVYTPAGTRSICKEHFLDFLLWRKKKGGMPLFKKYSAMSMEERDPTVDEWAKTVTLVT